MMVAMNNSARVAENYIEKKIAVKNYLRYLDDMEHRKGQHQKGCACRCLYCPHIDVVGFSALDSVSKF